MRWVVACGLLLIGCGVEAPLSVGEVDVTAEYAACRTTTRASLDAYEAWKLKQVNYSVVEYPDSLRPTNVTLHCSDGPCVGCLSDCACAIH